MGKKYIIEKDDNESIWSIYADANGDATIEYVSLTPYTEPDMEQVREDAFKNGYDAACKDIDVKSKINAAHRKGLEDAWEAARKVTQVRKYGGYGDCLGDVFGRTDTSWDVFDYSAPEAIEKIRQYEQEQEMDGLRQNIQTIVDQCGYTLDEIAEVLAKMKETDNG